MVISDFYLKKFIQLIKNNTDVWLNRITRLLQNLNAPRYTIVHQRVAACNSFPFLASPTIGTFSRSSLEGRVYRDLLVSFIARAINYGFIGQAGGQQTGLWHERVYGRGEKTEHEEILYSYRFGRVSRRHCWSIRNYKIISRIGSIDLN